MRGFAGRRVRRSVTVATLLIVLSVVSVSLVHPPAASAAAPVSGPTGVRALAGEGAVLCVWNRVGGGVAGYRIERATSTRGPWRLAGTSASPRFVDRIAVGGTIYYRVRAVRTDRRIGTASAAVRAGVVPATTGLRARAGESASVCEWDASTEVLVGGYVVERAESAAGPWSVIGTPAGTAFVDTSAAGRQLWYRVRCKVDAAVAGPVGVAVRATSVQAPQGLLAVTGDGVTVCRWSPVDGHSGSYVVERSSFAGGPWIGVGETTAVEFQDTKPLVGPCYYRVRALASDGVASEPSDAASAIVLAAPSALVAVRTAPGAVVGWQAGDALDVTYRVERADAADGPFVTAGETGGTRFTEDLTAESGAHYRVRAVFAGVAGPSTTPAEARAVPVPSGLSVTAGDGSDAVSWQSAAGVASYVVERSATGDGAWQLVAETSALSVDDAVSEAREWHYRVRAVGPFEIEGESSSPVQNSRIRMSGDVPAAGRVMRSANGRMTLSFPSGAFSSPTRVDVIEQSSAEAGDVIPVTPQYEFTASAPLMAPAQIVVAYGVPVEHFAAAEAIMHGSDWMSWDESSGVWVPVPTTIDTTASTLSASMPHFSEWRGAMQPHGTSLALVQSNSCNGVCHAITTVNGRQVVSSSKDASVCYSCHAGATAADAHGIGVDGPNIKAEFMHYGGADAFRPASQSRHPLAAPGAATAVSLNCVSCHDPHKSPVDAPQLLRALDAVTGKPVASAGRTAAGNEFCWACHGTKSNARVNLGVPNYYVNSGGDKKTYFTPSGHGAIACVGCHEGHGSPTSHGLAKGGGDPALCLGCHGGATPAGGHRIVASHRIVSAGASLPVDTGIPCADCHGPHGSAKGNAKLLSDSLGSGLSTGNGTAAMRRVCFTCHTTSEGLGWDSVAATYTAPAASAKVEGLPRSGGPAGSGPGGVGQNWLRLRPVTGHRVADTTVNCYDCHGNDYSSAEANNVHNPATYSAARHSATPASSTITILGVTYGPFACSSCHDLELGPEHQKARSSSSAAGCSACHPDPRASLAPWGKGCAQGGCHTAGSSAPLHAAVDPPHVTGAQSCTAAGCHTGAGNVAAIHSNATTTTPTGTRASCQVCHAAGVTPSATCSDCHDMLAPHGDMGSTHNASPGANWVDTFGGSDGPGCHGWECHGNGVWVDCNICHTVADVSRIHENRCEVCHASPRDTFTTWTKGCQQGGCHPVYHLRAAYVHDTYVNAGNCSCHPNGSGDYPVDPVQCTNCHRPAGDVTPPTTTSDAAGPYSGAALVRLTPSDPMPGSGAAMTYFILDGGTQKASRSVYVPAPKTGSVVHTVQFWSTDAAGNIESPRKNASFTVKADVIPPVTTSDAAGPYVIGPNTGSNAVITLNPVDESYDGVKATYYRVDGGAVATGTSIAVAGPAVAGSASHNIQFWSVDSSDNTETVKNASFTITRDSTPPTTTFSPAPYYKTSTAIPITAVDSGGSTVYRISFRYDSSSYWYNVYGAASSINPAAIGLGTHTVSYYAVDAVGNQATVATATLCYDTSLPITTSNAVGSYTGTATILLTPTDTYSGVATTYYRIDSGAQQTGTTITVPPPASGSVGHWIYWWSVDRATNTEATKSYYLTVAASGAFTLTYAAGANGSISGTSPQTVVSGGSGTAVTAVPNTGYHFANWSDGSTANPRTDTNVVANKSVTANFAINTYVLTYTAGVGGTISGTSPQNVNHGANGTTVTAQPNVGQHFVNWSDGLAAASRCEINVTANKSVTASFAPDGLCTLTYLAGSNGSVSGTTPQTVATGGSGTPVTAVPNTGYHFVDWSDGITANPRTDTSVLISKTVTANFSLNTSHTVTYLAGAGGTLSGATPQTIAWAGSGSAVTAVPDAGYAFINWSDGSTANPRVESNVIADLTLTANFSGQTHSLYSYANTGGTISPAGWLYNVPAGATQTYTIAPNAGQRIAAIQLDYDSVGGWRLPSSTFALTNVVADHYLYAYFGATGTVSRIYTYGAHGYCMPYGLYNVVSGSSGPTVTPVPNGGYHFVNWSDGLTANPRRDTNVTTDALVTPVFAPNTYTMTYTAEVHGAISGAAVQSVLYDSRGAAVTAVADPGYHFLGWNDGVLTASRSDVCQGDRAVSAMFASDSTYDVVFTSDGEGTITGTWAQSVPPGGIASAVTAFVYDSRHWEFSYWSDDLGNVSYANPLAITGVDRSQRWTAHYYNYYTGSCPFLFTWDGARFGFESDLFSTGKLGAVRSNGTYQKPNPNDFYVVEHTPALTDGRLEMRLVEERPETDYLDQFKLFAIDVPDGTDLAAVKIPAGGSYQPLSQIVHSVSSDPRHVSAVHVQDGKDMTKQVAEAHDGLYATLNPDREAPSYQTIEIDPGDVSGTSAFKLIVEGNSWTPETDAGKAISAQIPNSARQKIEVVGIDGQWTALSGTWPKPAEMARPYLIDLTGKFPTDDHRVRLTFVFETAIDSIRVDTTTDLALTATEVPMASAVLGHHGFDLHSMPGDIFDYVYGPPTATSAYMPGLYTRFGDVTPLLGGLDDKFAVFGGGDELTLRFDPLAAPAEGMTRRYVVYANGYYKWANTDIAQTVDPLPFAAMSNYPYTASEQYPADADHQAYLDGWNTRREVTP